MGRSSHLSDSAVGPVRIPPPRISGDRADGCGRHGAARARRTGGVKSHPGSQYRVVAGRTRIAFGSQQGELFLVEVESGRVSAMPIAGGGWLAPCGRSGLVAGRHAARVLDVRREQRRHLPLHDLARRQRPPADHDRRRFGALGALGIAGNALTHPRLRGLRESRMTSRFRARGRPRSRRTP